MFISPGSRAGRIRLVDGGGGNEEMTEYIEDVASVANPEGPVLILVRDDALSSQTSNDGDNIAARGTDKGELYVKHVDAIPVTQSGTWDEVGINDSGNSITVDDGGGSLTVDGTVAVSGTVAVTQSGTWDEVGINDSGNSITVDNGGTFAVQVSSIAAGDNNIGNVDVVTMPTVTVTNAGTFATQVDGAALTALQVIDNPVLVDDAAFTPASSSVMMVGFQADESSTDSVDEGDAGAARITLDRKLITQPQPHTTGGLSIFKSLDLDETEEAVKASPGQVYGYHFVNRTTSPLYLKFYNDTVANVIVGTTVPVMTLELPSNSTDHIAGHLSFPFGIAFDTAITVAVTTGFADNDTGAPGANHAIVHVWYK